MKAEKDFTIIMLPDASCHELCEFREIFNEIVKSPDSSPIIMNDAKIYRVKEGELFEVVSSEEKICDIKLGSLSQSTGDMTE